MARAVKQKETQRKRQSKKQDQINIIFMNNMENVTQKKVYEFICLELWIVRISFMWIIVIYNVSDLLKIKPK